MQNLQSKPTWKVLLKIAIPIIIANILQTVYQLIDTFWVGRLGKEAIASVSLSFPITFFLISVSMGFAMAGSIMVAQYYGKGDQEKIRIITGQTLSFVVVLSVLMGFLGFFVSEYILRFFTDDIRILEQGAIYMKLIFLSLPAMFAFMVIQGSLRGIREVKIPMLIILITVILNFFLDPILMYGRRFISELGIKGVALATVITEFLSAIIVFVYMQKRKIHINFSTLKRNLERIKKIIRLGLPSSIEHSSRSLGMVLMTFLVSTFGTLTIASYGIGTRILSFIIIPALGFAIATSSLVGNLLGAKNYEGADRVSKTAIKIGFLSLTTIGVLLFLGARYISHFFVPSDIEVIRNSALFIKIMALSFGLVSAQMVMLSSIKASGKTMTSMFLAISQTIVLLLFSVILSKVFNFGELGIRIAYPVSNLTALGISYLVYRKKTWLRQLS